MCTLKTKGDETVTLAKVIPIRPETMEEYKRRVLMEHPSHPDNSKVRPAIEVKEIRGRKEWMRYPGHSAVVKPGESVLLHGREDNNRRLAPNGRPALYATFFKIGDEAEYGSYNLIYTGKITAITAKTVTITEYNGTAHRMSLYDFDRRNWDFDAAEVAKFNARTMMEI